MKVETPVYDAEFGCILDLHDGKIKNVDATETDNGKDMIWTIHVFQESLNSKGEERAYLYRLRFKSCRGNIPEELVGKEIYRAWFLPLESCFAVILILLPCGLPYAFVSDEITELSLERS